MGLKPCSIFYASHFWFLIYFCSSDDEADILRLFFLDSSCFARLCQDVWLLSTGIFYFLGKKL